MGPEDEHTFKKDIEAFQYRLKDYIRVEGATIKELTGTTASPRDHFDVLIDLIAGTTGIPKRILTGSERGELASTQDQEAWRQRISRRQTTFAEQSMLRPLIDRLVLLRALPTPAQPYTVVWENLLALSSEKQALVAKDIATALSQYAGQGMAETVVPVEEFRSTYLGIAPESDYAVPVDVDPGEDLRPCPSLSSSPPARRNAASSTPPRALNPGSSCTAKPTAPIRSSGRSGRWRSVITRRTLTPAPCGPPSGAATCSTSSASSPRPGVR